MFGAHFPLDVLVGAVLGYELGLFAGRLMANARLLPQPEPRAGRRRLALPRRATSEQEA
jgi:membrane-associated phospholipid phosphatase